jgi:hypothetical protein
MPTHLRDSKLAAILLTTMCGACDAPELEFVAPDQEVSLRGHGDNGVELNGAELNGVGLNGFRTNGVSLNGWTLNGWTLNGWTLNGWTLNGTEIEGTYFPDGEAVIVKGPELIGSEMVLTHSGEDFKLRFTDIFKNPADPNGDLYFYFIEVFNEQTQTWYAMCEDMYGDPSQAIPLRNYWDTATGARVDDATAVTFACRGGAIAKCVEWGYEPWNGYADHHQACTRMARADYCGNGVPYTLNGTPIDMFDTLIPQIQAPVTSNDPMWSIEAEWGPEGALCLGADLRYDMLAGVGIERDPPPCRAALAALPSCGTFPGSRPSGRVANTYCPEWIDDREACGL